MFKHILVPTDFGPAADRALELALALATKFDSELELVHAFSVPDMAYVDTLYVPLDELMQGARRAFEETASRATSRYPKTRATWLDGDARVEIVAAAARSGVDLVVMGTHGRQALSRAVLGSIADRIVRTSPVPVLTTRALPEERHDSAKPPITHVLVPTDFGEPAWHALRMGARLAQAFDARLTLLHVYPLPLTLYDERMKWPSADIEREAERALQATLAGAKRRWGRAEAVLAHGDARDRNLEAAEERAADLVVMGTHGRRGLSRLLLGSVAERIVRTSPIPVLTVSGERK